LLLFPGDINLLADESKDSKHRDEKEVPDGHAKKTEVDYGGIVRKFYCSSTLLYRTIQKMTARCIPAVIVPQYSSGKSMVQ
jgi:hypothetical protein